MSLFIHAADLHLDSPLKGIESYEGAPDIDEIRGATRQVLIKLVDLALEEQVRLLTFAGDLYDGDWQDFSTGLFFAQQMQRLKTAGIQVAIVLGNHDAANKMTKTLDMPQNVRILSAKKPETVQYQDFGVAVHGQSYAVPETTQNLAVAYPDPVPGMINIGLLHCLLSGSAGHQSYAPCTLDDLAAKEYDYWALGHVHDYTVLRQQPLIVYSGCCQGRHIKETGPKGCVLVSHDGDTLTQEFVWLSDVRWLALTVDIDGAGTIGRAMELFAQTLEPELAGSDGQLHCIRVTLKGRTSLHGRMVVHPEEITANLRAAAADLSGHQVWIEKVILQTNTLLDLGALAQTHTPQGELLRYLQELQTGKELDLDLTPLKSKLAASGVVVPPEDDPELLQGAKDLLISMLLDTDRGEAPNENTRLQHDRLRAVQQ